MKKNKKKKAAKKAALLGGTAKSLRKLSKNSVGKLSTTQKVLAGATLGVLGVRYLVKKLGKPKATTAEADYASAGASNDTFGTAASE
ncbi:hypothetical protein [Hymenobacter cheonanensis]|uniref:hypothetical protein n=1 Tax=Hymenobacter sp. CA2-7 TaxID=3063993 RepID=UPI0027129969|nr:hypothetical protein [Hymenobacter sp. CA2-7]MDO7885964.1 hypothetical protein [Hymenobacter sp. CA2-7]